MRVLLCDDNRDDIQKVKRILKEIPYIDYVMTCCDGKEAVCIYKNNPIDLIITDIDMPKINGINLVKEISSNMSNRVDVIFMTGYPDYSILSHDCRAIDFLLKPIDEGRLIESVNIANDMMISRSLIRNKKLDEEIFIYKFRKNINMINYENILFFEKVGREIKILTTDGEEIRFYEDFTTLKERVPGYFFVSSSKHIINLKKIYKVSPNTRNSFEISFLNENAKALLDKKLESDFLFRYHKSKY